VTQVGQWLGVGGVCLKRHAVRAFLETAHHKHLLFTSGGSSIDAGTNRPYGADNKKTAEAGFFKTIPTPCQ